MFLGQTGHQIIRGSQGQWWYLWSGETEWKVAEDVNQETLVKEIYKAYRSSKYSDDEKTNILKINMNILMNGGGTSTSTSTSTSGNTPVTSQFIEKVASDLISFFSEFHFEPNFRFVNTLSLVTKDPAKNPIDFIESYFELQDSQYTSSIVEKMKSTEFSDIISRLRNIPTTTQINNRFKVYYGSQGTGKTTEGFEECEGRCIVCHSSMLPQDLMEDFSFDDGKAGFNPSALYRAMEEGKSIMLDEINLLPYDSLRFLQSILDGKAEFIYKNKTVKIAEGFTVIGTMNLIVNEAVFSLPAPLIDRASELKKFTLTAQKLVGALV